MITIVAKLSATTEKDKPAVDGQVKFTGAAIYNSYYPEVGIQEMENEREKCASSKQKEKIKEEKNKKIYKYLPALSWTINGTRPIQLKKVVQK